MTASLEERKVGAYTVKELSLRQLMDLQEQHPEGGKAMTVAMMGAMVHNGTGQPIGADAALDLPARVAMKLQAAVTELTVSDEESEKNG